MGRCLSFVHASQSFFVAGVHRDYILGLNLLLARSFANLWLDKRPSFHSFRVFLIFKLFKVLKNLSFLLIRAAEADVLVFVLLYRRFGSSDWKTALSDLVPVNFGEELVPLDLFCTFRACAKSSTRVAVQQMHD